MKTTFGLVRVKAGTFVNESQQNVFFGAAYTQDVRSVTRDGYFDTGMAVQKLGIDNIDIANKLNELVKSNINSLPVSVTCTIRLDGKEGEKSTLTIVAVDSK